MENEPSWAELLQEYRKDSDNLAELVKDLQTDQLDLAPEQGGWNIRQIIHHIIDGNEIWKSFIKQALGGQDRPFELFWYWDLTQDEWAEKWRYGSRPIEPALGLYLANRDYLLSILSPYPEASTRSLEICWPAGDSSIWTIRDALKWDMEHTRNHLMDIRSILSKKAD
jgi:hypothetical protein